MDGRTLNFAALWRQALARGAIWRRGLVIGLVAGSLQVAVNQGDIWWRGAADGGVVLKTILSPLIALGLAVTAAAWSDVARQQSQEACGDHVLILASQLGKEREHAQAN